MPQPPKKKPVPKKAEKPLAVDPFVEAQVRDRMASFELANALAQANATPTRPNAPRDEYGFVSPYRAQAKARVDQNTLGPDSPWYPQFTMRESPDMVAADKPAFETSSAFRKAYAEREDTDRARVNAYSLVRAMEDRKRRRDEGKAPYRY